MHNRGDSHSRVGSRTKDDCKSRGRSNRGTKGQRR